MSEIILKSNKTQIRKILLKALAKGTLYEWAVLFIDVTNDSFACETTK